MLNKHLMKHITTLTSLVTLVTLNLFTLGFAQGAQQTSTHQAQSQQAQTQKQPGQKHHAHENYMGSHGMALIRRSNGDILAYHMALYAKPHDFQLLYQLSLTHEQKQKIGSLAFHTLLPDNFDLQRLVKGETITIGANLYAGHFERGGEKIARFEQVTFAKRLYKNQLPARNATPVTDHRFHFDLIALSNNETLAIHTIRLRPSFDAIVTLPTPAGNQTQFTCQNRAVAQQAQTAGYDAQLIGQLTKSCLSRKPVYREFVDFR